MKKLLLLSLLFPAMAIAQIPNGDLENWSGGLPVGWTINQIPGYIYVTQIANAQSGAAVAKYEIGGPLVDPGLTLQTIRFAITSLLTNSIYSWKATGYPSSGIFPELLDLKERPRSLNEGQNMIFWFSTEAKREHSQGKFGGTFFVHGCYFAHNVEPDGPATKSTHGRSLFQYGGGRVQFNHPDSVPSKWIRSANGDFL